MKRATQLTIFSTLLMVAMMLALYLFTISELEAEMSPIHLLLLIPTVLFAYVASAIVIDQTLNPLRLMISKVRDIGNMDFSKPLVIDGSDDELREYVTAFNEMSQKLNRHIELQKRFISDASHELATPITVINGHADMLLRRKDEHPEIIDNGLEIIKSEILKMDGLIDSLLLLARSDSGRQSYTFEQTGLSELIIESIEEARLVAPDFTFNAAISPNITANVDEYAIRRVLRIILSNAIKYSGDSKEITAEATITHEMVNITIKDNGIGIAEEHLPYIFDRFYRVDPSRTKKTGSSGLGLAIAKEIIDAHSGEIKVTSLPEKGTELVIILSTYKPSSNLHIPHKTTSPKLR